MVPVSKPLKINMYNVFKYNGLNISDQYYRVK